MSGWQPIEIAPKDGTKILVWDAEEGPCVVSWADHASQWRGAWGREDYVQDGSIFDDPLVARSPTHWMPLPEKPDATPQDH